MDSKHTHHQKIISFSRSFLPLYWDNDRGGLLTIIEHGCQNISTHKPFFNTLTPLKVPQSHFVSQASNFAQGQCLTATDWLIVK